MLERSKKLIKVDVVLDCILETDKIKVAVLLVVTLVEAGWLGRQWFR